MIEQFKDIIYLLTQKGSSTNGKEDGFSICDSAEQFKDGSEAITTAKRLNAAFLITLAGKKHPLFSEAKEFLDSALHSLEWAEVARFYLDGIDYVFKEINNTCEHDADFKNKIESLYEWLSDGENPDNNKETIEKIWSLFFPEATGINRNKNERIESLRKKRTVTVSEPNSNPITDPAEEILFTSNILLTIPDASKPIKDLSFSSDLKDNLAKASREQQLFWYDHPVQIGVEPDKNEILYGLRCLDEALEFECERGNKSPNTKLICVLSASVTHRSLQDVARKYIEEEFARAGALKNINICVFTELDTRQIIDKILLPAASHYLDIENEKDLIDMFGMFGVDGEYGRHYSFLKAIAAFWQVFHNPNVKATFKIDLDQVFPQKELVEQTGASAFDHFKSPLWGAKGFDSNNQPVELGMIAGALVNQHHIINSVFTPDVSFPDRELKPDEHIFFSLLPQALSTEGEMMTRYSTDELDGKRTCIQRVHVTGGTNGILIESLYRHKPFTPSFVGRAEDQAYILSVLSNPGIKLAYVHKDGLIMRHDKEGFAQEAIQSAYIGKLLGDYVRIIYFSAYAEALTNDVGKLKDAIDPFTGCFISKIPLTVVYLRFALKAWSLFKDGKDDTGNDFIINGAKRISNTLNVVSGNGSPLKQIYTKERVGWNAYYDTLSAIKNGLNKNDDFAIDLRKKAKDIIEQCFISFETA
ncbi:MAG: hypothetical protein ACUZ8O_14095 [Candidatus Anammoxibacter sp.]